MNGKKYHPHLHSQTPVFILKTLACDLSVFDNFSFRYWSFIHLQSNKHFLYMSLKFDLSIPFRQTFSTFFLFRHVRFSIFWPYFFRHLSHWTFYFSTKVGFIEKTQNIWYSPLVPTHYVEALFFSDQMGTQEIFATLFNRGMCHKTLNIQTTSTFSVKKGSWILKSLIGMQASGCGPSTSRNLDMIDDVLQRHGHVMLTPCAWSNSSWLPHWRCFSSLEG